MMQGQCTDEPDNTWELVKENAAPLERGRDVKSIKNSFGESNVAGGISDKQQRRIEKTIQHFEQLIKPSEEMCQNGDEAGEAGELLRSMFNVFDFLDAIRHQTIASNTCILNLSVHSLNPTAESTDDPLRHWLSYIKFIQDTYPSDTQQSFLLMERCTRAFVGVARYTHDVRFIRVCILYADRTSSPVEVYKVRSTPGFIWYLDVVR